MNSFKELLKDYGDLEKYTILMWNDQLMFNPRSGRWESVLSDEERLEILKSYNRLRVKSDEEYKKIQPWFEGGVT